MIKTTNKFLLYYNREGVIFFNCWVWWRCTVIWNEEKDLKWNKKLLKNLKEKIINSVLTKKYFSVKRTILYFTIIFHLARKFIYRFKFVRCILLAKNVSCVWHRALFVNSYKILKNIYFYMGRKWHWVEWLWVEFQWFVQK